MTLETMVSICAVLSKYEPKAKTFAAEHDVLYFPGPALSDMSAEDIQALELLGVSWTEEHESWYSFV